MFNNLTQENEVVLGYVRLNLSTLLGVSVLDVALLPLVGAEYIALILLAPPLELGLGLPKLNLCSELGLAGPSRPPRVLIGRIIGCLLF